MMIPSRERGSILENKMLLTPNGEPAGDMDRTMLLSLWAKQLSLKGTQNIYRAGMGRPTYPVNSDAALSAAWYWLRLASKAFISEFLLRFFPSFSDRYISMLSPAIDYGHPQGEPAIRHRMAKALNRWYGDGVGISADNILFTVGGAATLRCAFDAINRRIPNGRIVTQIPFYTLYKGSHGQNNLYPIHSMENPGYQFRAWQLRESIEEAYKLAKKDGKIPSAFLLCDPNNPLGTTLDKAELRKIADVLRKYPNLYIILDEAYAEMRLDGQRISLLSEAPDLKNRMILMRSATKALSAAGERMAVTIVFNNRLRDEMVTENIAICGHVPKSLQIAFTHAMEKLTPKKQRNLMNYYAPQMAFVQQRIKEMGAEMPDPEHRITGAFYVIANLHPLIGTPINKACFQVLPRQKTSENGVELIKTDEEIIYHLLFSYGIMIAPFSYFGINNRLGYVRITCSAGKKELNELMNKLEEALKSARAFKKFVPSQEKASHHEGMSIDNF